MCGGMSLFKHVFFTTNCELKPVQKVYFDKKTSSKIFFQGEKT